MYADRILPWRHLKDSTSFAMPLDPVSLGILLLLTGLVFFLLVWGLPRLIYKTRSSRLLIPVPQDLNDNSNHNHAVLIVQSGGRVDYINATARQWLDVHDGEHPNLEVLARRIRPSDDFLKLCATEGQVRFSVNGRPMEAVSYQVPGLAASLLISMRRPDLATAQVGEVQEISNSAMKILTDLGKSVAASPDLDSTIQAILENLERLVPKDLLEIKIWKNENQTLIPYRMGSRPGSEPKLEKGVSSIRRGI